MAILRHADDALGLHYRAAATLYTIHTPTTSHSLGALLAYVRSALAMTTFALRLSCQGLRMHACQQGPHAGPNSQPAALQAAAGRWRHAQACATVRFPVALQSPPLRHRCRLYRHQAPAHTSASYSYSSVCRPCWSWCAASTYGLCTLHKHTEQVQRIITPATRA